MLRLTEAMYEALTGNKSKDDVCIAGGYRSKWQGWAVVGTQRCYFRSIWEHNYACYLQWQVDSGALSSWEHEPKQFKFEGYKNRPHVYTPDFKLTYLDGTHSWSEVKGWLNSKSRSKINRFEKHYPDEGKITIIDGLWFKSAAKMARLIPGWKPLSTR